ncbi:MAG TPA: hypothetical protein VL625_09360 [Patescibacteria group bacterium]|nr:hypothetical protein [Patescibacteria group bacterium]
MTRSAITLDLSPLLPHSFLYGIAGLALLFIVLSFFFYRRGLPVRTVVVAAFILMFLNPSIAQEQRGPIDDVAVIVADHSPSQQNGERLKRTDAALSYLKKKLESLPGLEVRLVDSSSGETGPPRETKLFDKLDQALADVPASRRAGVVMITDGQVHDVPQDVTHLPDYGPVSVLLSGSRDEHDRQLVILEAPSYGIVGQTVKIRYRIDDGTAGRGETATLNIHQDGLAPQAQEIPVNEDQDMTVTVPHGGQNILDLSVSPADNEITLANNRVPVVINGVRDRLRVLLVSGQPYAGGRTWRNILTSDPGVDLVHFTILREPDKIDATPQNDLSLIAFPFEELFQTKLYGFDLIIFDRYRLNRILPDYYFGNIAKYVKAGGALLVTTGPSFASSDSLFKTDLSQVLTAQPTGRVIEEPFRPALTKAGLRHPVTQGLQWPGGKDGEPGWGAWLRQVAIAPSSGEVVMSGAEHLPLLVLDHAGKGRVAELASDQIWLWSRGYGGGGPHAELLRRLAHWLMKEPELEENALDVSVDGGKLHIVRRSLTEDSMAATVTAPDGAKSTIELKAGTSGALEATIPAPQLGVYAVNDGAQERLALVGSMNPPELTGVRTTAEKLAPVVKAEKGTTIWLADEPEPAIDMLPPGRGAYGGGGWIGLRQNGSYTVTGVTMRPFLPAWLYATALLALLIGAWWQEGRSRR